MKIADIASEVYNELGEPTDFSIPVVAYWLRANIGLLNSAINTRFYVNPTTLEFERVDTAYGANDQIIQMDDDEKAIMKLLFIAHFYNVQIRKNIITYGTRFATSVTSDGHSVKVISATEVGKNLYMFLKGIREELTQWINYYQQARSTPCQVTGDDLVVGETSNSRPIFRRTYSYYNLR